MLLSGSLQLLFNVILMFFVPLLAKEKLFKKHKAGKSLSSGYTQLHDYSNYMLMQREFLFFLHGLKYVLI